jgi:hypothetical protein
LHLNVDECIWAYQRLCGQIFEKESYPLSFVGKLKGRFSTTNLERFLKEVVGEHINGRSAEHELFNSENDAESQLCKVYAASLPYPLTPFANGTGLSAQQDMKTSTKLRGFDPTSRLARRFPTMQQSGRQQGRPLLRQHSLSQ